MHSDRLLKDLLLSCDVAEAKTLFFQTSSNTTFDFSNRIETILNGDRTCEIQIHYNKKGNIKDVFVSESFDVKACIEVIKATLIENQGLTYASRIAYSTNKLRGYYRAADIFQVMPITTGRDETLYTTAGEPLRIEFSYIGCSDPFINMSRAENKCRELIHLLNVLLRDSVKLGRRYSKEEWFHDYVVGNNSTAFPGYIENTSVNLNTGFSSVESVPPAPILTPPQFYESMLVITGEEMAFPSHLPILLEAYASLNPDERRFYNIALSWYSDAHEIAPVSSSACFNALTTAIECLLDNDSETCKDCGQSKFGISKKFNEFLLRYVPAANGVDRAKSFKELYSTRSVLVHGYEKYSHDLFATFISMESNREKAELRFMLEVVKIALINWLNAKWLASRMQFTRHPLQKAINY